MHPGNHKVNIYKEEKASTDIVFHFHDLQRIVVKSCNLPIEALYMAFTESILPEPKLGGFRNMHVLLQKRYQIPRGC